MARRPQYTIDSLTRALDHHVSTGALGFYRRVAEMKDGWHVELPHFGVVTFTTAQLAGLTNGLAASEKRWKDDSRTSAMIDVALELLETEAVRTEESEEVPPPFSSVAIAEARDRRRRRAGV